MMPHSLPPPQRKDKTPAPLAPRPLAAVVALLLDLARPGAQATDAAPEGNTRE